MRAGRLRMGIIPARAGFTRARSVPGWTCMDHPRSRGVYIASLAQTFWTGGSSPLARGLRDQGRLRASGAGIIPARAGYTSLMASTGPGRRDHPRSRGVYGEGLVGHPPRTRIIPARAGFTDPELIAPGVRGDHPRSRGVYWNEGEHRVTLLGSSPLARGLLGGRPAPAQEARIIPARAGFTGERPRTRGPRSDHPRSRGVYSRGSMTPLFLEGSSPLARGLPHPGEPCPRPPRIIPARAGFTCPTRPRRGETRDHPRSRGVYRRHHGRRWRPEGSSPLARGLRPADRHDLGQRRIIPARAGFTPGGTGCATPRKDHPRSRGVYLRMKRQLGPESGSSPLARGLPAAASEYDVEARIIPARAGFTLLLPHIRIALRIIPARAGFTLGPPRPRTRTKDHPRSRGVYESTRRHRTRDSGSSPLARGLQAILWTAWPWRRIIPARAGFTFPPRAR